MFEKNELQSMTDDRNAIMGRLIVAEGLLKDSQDKVKQVEDQLVKCQQIKEDNLGIAERWQNRHDDLKAQLEQVKGWLREARAGWSGSDSEFTEYYGDLAEMLGVEFTEEVTVTLLFVATVTVKMPIGYELDTTDFWVKGSPSVDTSVDEVEMLDSVELYLDDVTIEK